VETEIRKIRVAETERRREEGRNWKKVGRKRGKTEREKEKPKEGKKNGSKKSSRGVEDLG